MNGIDGVSRPFSRRGFLKTTGTIAGGVALSSMVGCAPTGSESFVDPGEGDQIFRGVCRPNCQGFCHLNVHVRDGNVVKTSRAPYNNPAYNRICHRGLSHVQRIYDPERLQYPLRRVEGTERGDNQWERISWDEAIDEIANKITTLQSEYGKQAVSFMDISGNMSLAKGAGYSRLLNILQATNIGPCVDMASYYGIQRMCGPLTNMWEGNENTDLVNAKTIVAWGNNITDALVQTWHFVNEAQSNGTKLVVIDPNFTQIAGKSDMWVPLRPGTDMLVYMTVMNIYLEKNYVDKDFMLNNTCAPFLVHPKTKKFFRRSDTGIDPEPTGQMNPLTGLEVMYDPYMVDDGGELAILENAKKSNMEGKITYNGLELTSSYNLLLEEIEKFPPSKVSEMTEIPEETLYELADIFADGPVAHFIGYGPQAHSNGVHSLHAGMTMAAMTGNLGKPGACFGSFWYLFFGANAACNMPTGLNPTPSVQQVDLVNVMQSGKFMGKDFPIKFMLIYSANPLNTCPDTNALINEVWKKMDYIVVVDSMMTDSARYADLVLPAAQWFEVEDISHAGQTVAINYNEKAIEPLFESKDDYEIARLIAEKLEIAQYFPSEKADVLRENLTSPLCDMFGISYESAKEKKEIRFLPDEPYIAWKDGKGFSNASGRLEFYLENPLPRAASTKEITEELMDRERLPHWFPPKEAWPESEAMQKYPFYFLSERPRFRVHSQWYNVKALRELDPEPIVKINPKDADEKGIEDGSYVECFNDRGSAVGRAIYSEAVRPGVLVYPKGWQRHQHKAGGWSELLDTDFDPFAVNGNFMDCVCDIRSWHEGGAK